MNQQNRRTRLFQPSESGLMTRRTKNESQFQPNTTTGINLQQKVIGIGRILFGVAWAVGAILKWQPAFIQSFASIVGAGKQQPLLIQSWTGLWVHIVQINPTLFAVMAASTETFLAICFLFGIFTNSAAFLGIFWSFFIWSVPESFGGPYVAGQSTDIGTGFPYLILSVVLLVLSAGRYWGIDRLFTAKLGRFGFLAFGPLKEQKTATSARELADLEMRQEHHIR